MVVKLAKLSKKEKVITSIAVVSLIAGTGYQVNKLADEPTSEKDCPPIFSVNPNSTEEQVSDTDASMALENNLKWAQKRGTINDISCLNRTSVYGIIEVENEEDIKNAISLAKLKGLKMSTAGVRHSMGGQAFYHNTIVLDMTKFNSISLDKEQKTVRVQSGATWHGIQNLIHPEFAVKAMQSTDIFTVGGSISVNAHGMDHQSGSVGNSIISMRIINSNGEKIELSPNKNSDLFNLVIGGYGLFGVIVDADLEVVQNDTYRTERQIVDYKDFTNEFDNNILTNNKIGLFYGHLSTAKSSLLREMILYKYEKAELPESQIPPLSEIRNVKLRRLIFNLSKAGPLPMEAKWYMEKNLEPRLETCSIVPRTAAMAEGESCFVSRNEPMHDSVKYIRNNLPSETDILHEYFIPKSKFVEFTDGLRDIVIKEKVNLLNASVRVAHPEKNFLSYSPTETYSVVLYINQKTTPEGNEKMANITKEIIDLATNLGGRFFLPYQLHYSEDQLKRAYPEIERFFQSKREHDPDGVFTNTFYEKYSRLIT